MAPLQRLHETINDDGPATTSENKTASLSEKMSTKKSPINDPKKTDDYSENGMLLFWM